MRSIIQISKDAFVFEGNSSLYYFYRLKGSSKVYVAVSENYGQTWDSLNVISGLTFCKCQPKKF
ncbi:MAG: hypothetical protein U5K00_17840 [Melioribacteraceae bacterium]|nr:hypothetical protein [Melioribacteraceae bacterium]